MTTPTPPSEPTPEMLRAGIRELFNLDRSPADAWEDVLRRAYRVMRARELAAPPPVLSDDQKYGVPHFCPGCFVQVSPEDRALCVDPRTTSTMQKAIEALESAATHIALLNDTLASLPRSGPRLGYAASRTAKKRPALPSPPFALPRRCWRKHHD